MMKVTVLSWTKALGRRKGALLAVAALLLLAATACQKGAYQVDVFPEQHYQQSLKKQEPPRLSPPDGAVPVTGRELALDPAAADKTPNPLPRTREVLTQGADVFRVNCSMCHGLTGQGDGTVGAKLVQYGYARPPNLNAPATQSKTDGTLFWTITNGIVVMPKFGLLLSEQDRWSAVQYLRYLAEQPKG